MSLVEKYLVKNPNYKNLAQKDQIKLGLLKMSGWLSWQMPILDFFDQIFLSNKL